MNRGKKLLALLLALAMVFALAACGGSAGTAGKEEETVAKRHASRGEETPARETEAPAEETPEPTPELTPEPTPEPTPDPKDLLIGSWRGTADMTEQLLSEVAGGLEGTELDLNFADYLQEPFALPLNFEFREDGTFRAYIKDEDLAGLVTPLQNAMKAFFTDVLYETLMEQLPAAGIDVSGVSSMSDLEELLGMTVDEMMAQSGQAEGLDSFVESMFNLNVLRQFTADVNMEGVYTVDGDTLQMDGDVMTISFPDADTLIMDGDDGGAGLLPITLERVQ